MALTVVLFTLLTITGVIANGNGQMSATEIEYCCNLVSEMEDCHSECVKFASKCPPVATNKTEYLKDYCPDIPAELDVCLSNTNLSNSQSKPTPSPELIACCSSSDNQACEDKCIEELYIGELDDASILRVIGQCGFPIMVNADPIWSCFFEFADDTPTTTESTNNNVSTECSSETTPSNPTEAPPFAITYADWPRLECCSRANSTGCREACEREYSGNRIEGTWEKINQDCIYQANEDELAICLADVNSQCVFGCSGLDFCQNLNNRPLQLYRGCTMEADSQARQSYTQWKVGIIQLPTITIQTKDVSTCQPDLWRAAACAIYTRPCNNHTHSSILCKDECLQLMEECSIDDKTPQEICEILSPSHLQDGCVSIGQFTDPSPYPLAETESITSPCQPNPCAESRHCVVNHYCSGNKDRQCTPYTCMEESLLGKSPELSMVRTDIAHVTTLPPAGRRCYGFVREVNHELGQQLTDLSNEYCKPDVGQCSFEGNHYDQGEVFNLSDGCNFCTCFHGNVLCSNHACLEATKLIGPTPLLSCDCPAYFAPVCTADGRTLPNGCIAGCLEYTVDQITAGSCADQDPCDSAQCPVGTKCIPRRHVCLTGTNSTISSCQQYSCESYFSCNQFYGPVCDESNQQHSSVCNIFLTQKKIDYFGYCQLECSSGRSQRVCGVNGETYSSKCHAFQVGVAVDYIGQCREIPGGSQECEAVKCPGAQYFSTNETCKGPIPPGACCRQCGGLLKVIIDKDGLQYTSQAMNTTSVHSTAILARMRSQLNVLECRLDGYLAIDNTFVFTLTPTNYSTFLNVEICNMEAVRLATLINTRSPIIVSDPLLHFLVGATPTLATTDFVPPFVQNNVFEPNGCGQSTPILYMLIVLVTTCIYYLSH